MKHISIKLIVFIFAFLFMTYYNYFKPKDFNYKQKIILFWGEDCFHLHHWLSLTILIIIMVFSRYSSLYAFEIAVVILVAFILEGFMFGNFLNIFYKRCENLHYD